MQSRRLRAVVRAPGPAVEHDRSTLQDLERTEWDSESGVKIMSSPRSGEFCQLD